jgi:hypothetical protein
MNIALGFNHGDFGMMKKHIVSQWLKPLAMFIMMTEKKQQILNNTFFKPQLPQSCHISPSPK